MVAETEEIAAEAVKLVHVDYEALPVYRTPEEATAPDAVTINKQFKDNIIFEAGFEKGDIEAAFASATYIAKMCIPHPISSTHIWRQRFAVQARRWWHRALVSDSKWPRAQRDLVNILNMPLEKIRVIPAPLAGAFGGKDSLLFQGAIASASLKCGKPVMLTLSREDSFKIAPKRLPFKIYMKTAADKNGKVVAHQVKLIGTGGAYNCYASGILMFAMENAFGCYYTENFKIEAKLIATNNALSSAFRALVICNLILL